MANLTTIEIKAHLPAKDFELSKRFYQDLGFTLAWSSEGLAYLHHGKCSFRFWRRDCSSLARSEARSTNTEI